MRIREPIARITLVQSRLPITNSLFNVFTHQITKDNNHLKGLRVSFMHTKNRVQAP